MVSTRVVEREFLKENPESGILLEELIARDWPKTFFVAPQDQVDALQMQLEEERLHHTAVQPILSKTFQQQAIILVFPFPSRNPRLEFVRELFAVLSCAGSFSEQVMLDGCSPGAPRRLQGLSVFPQSSVSLAYLPTKIA